jgi:hypothetical protein
MDYTIGSVSGALGTSEGSGEGEGVKGFCFLGRERQRGFGGFRSFGSFDSFNSSATSFFWSFPNPTMT